MLDTSEKLSKSDFDSAAGEKTGDAEGHVGYAEQEIDENSTDEELSRYIINPAEEKALLRRLDVVLGPLVCVLYLIAFLDRSQLGNAASAGMLTDVGAPVNGLSVTASIFYVTYVTFEPLWTTIMKTVKASRMLPAVVIAWGAVVLGNGFIKNYPSLIACRLILGLLESALTPCLFLILSLWYQRNELAWRTAIMFVAAAVSGVVGGLVCAGFIKLDGHLGLRGWEHIYVWLGVITIVLGMISPFFIADSYHTAWFLTPRQKLLMRVRDLHAAEYRGKQDFSWGEVKRAFKDPIVYISGAMQFGFDICLYGFSTFLVVIVKALGYSTINSQLLTAPVYAWAAIVYLVCAAISDRKDMRFWLIFPTGCVTIIGYVLLVAVQHSTAVSLFACFLCATGIYSAVGLNVSWNAISNAGDRKRATAIGIQQLVGNLGGVVAGQIYRSTDKPYYRLGHACSLGAMVWAICWMFVYVAVLKKRNARKLALTEEEKNEMIAQGATGDQHPNFMYKW
ncbi:hypothetical protein BMF94_2183 [Rhodotorula taiwanensis]|uniref:Major facilitator superfamily (MFS) profile domain-containing protein n=1 Tax=Rhodotorula taiwanensis TaxID=741276 RepID=A0A2S5BD71_9BASI|nr:hypothetical protein BMF94_2183 [Rhodotorula taiwanensis]